MFNNYLYIFIADGMNAKASAAEIKSATFVARFIGVSEAADATEVAVSGVAAGAQLIELCGAFGPADVTRIVEATNGKVPVGAVTFPLTALTGLNQLFGAA